MVLAVQLAQIIEITLYIKINMLYNYRKIFTTSWQNRDEKIKLVSNIDKLAISFALNY